MAPTQPPDHRPAADFLRILLSMIARQLEHVTEELKQVIAVQRTRRPQSVRRSEPGRAKYSAGFLG